MTISDLRTKIIADQGYTSIFGTPKVYADLDAKEQVAVTNAMEAFIVSNPDQFTSDQVATAAKAQQGGGIDIPTDYTVTDATSDFVNEAANQAVDLNNKLNPFSEANRAGTAATVKGYASTLVYVAIAGAVVYFVGPVLIGSFLKNKAAKPPLPS